jgi:hypothetical protein
METGDLGEGWLSEGRGLLLKGCLQLMTNVFENVFLGASRPQGRIHQRKMQANKAAALCRLGVSPGVRKTGKHNTMR